VTGRDEFIDYLLELLEPMGQLQARRMFGGCGIFKDGLMFALVSGQMLYLKADELNRADFEKAGLEKFSYMRAGKLAKLSYYQAPGDALEDSDLLVEWAGKSYAAAVRKTAKPGRK